MRRIGVGVLIVPAGLSLIGCQDQPPTGIGATHGSSVASAAVPVRDERPDEAEMLALAERIPGLAGYHFEPDGELVVGLTDAGRAEQARAALADVAGRGSGRMRVRPAAYTFLELRGW